MPTPDPPDRPSVSVILAVWNEVEFIEGVLSDLLGQNYPGPLQVVVADGGSDDGTREKLDDRAAKDERLIVLHNPERRQAHGLNLAAERATGEILVRADGHTAFAPDYVGASVTALEETGGAVGGRMFPVGRTRFGRAVAAAMKSPLTMGPGRFHHSLIREEVDTVYLGAMRREWFETLGGFRAFASGTSEDADLYFRWRRHGGKVLVDPSISSEYTPRDHPRALWRQYFRYGMGKAEMLWRNGAFPSWRPLAPLALVVGLLLFVVVGLVTGVWVPLLVLAGLWLLLLVWVALRADEPTGAVLLAAGIMHLAYGLGELWGLVRGPGPRAGGVILGAALWVALIVAILVRWDEVKAPMVEAGVLFPVSVVLVVMALASGAMGWAVIQPRAARRRALVGFLASQPAKYLPGGGAFQALGQIGLSSAAKSDRLQLGWAFLVHAGVSIVTGAQLSLLLLLSAGAEPWLRFFLVVLAISGAISLRPSVIVWLAGLFSKYLPRLRPTGQFPDTASLWRSCGWTLGALAFSGSAFVTLMRQWADPLEGLAVLGAFSLAWLVGFVIFPLPSGLGAREVVLVGLLTHLPPGQVLGMSVMHRFASIVAEMLVLLLVSRRAFDRKE